MEYKLVVVIEAVVLCSRAQVFHHDEFDLYTTKLILDIDFGAAAAAAAAAADIAAINQTAALKK